MEKVGGTTQNNRVSSLSLSHTHTGYNSRHLRCCLFCVKVNDKGGMKSAEKSKTTARVQDPPSQLIEVHTDGSHNGPLTLTLHLLHLLSCVCVCETGK